VARAKGSAVLGFVRFLRLNRERALEALSSELHHYLDHTRVMVSSWYPEEDFLALLKAQAKLLGGALEQMGEVGARYDLTGVYKALVRPGDPVATLKNGAGLWRNYHDSGRIVVTSLEPKSVRVELHDYPIVDGDLCRLNTGYFAEGLRIAGAEKVRVRHVACTSRDDARCGWEASWS
jgi:hypothetical protein